MQDLAAQLLLTKSLNFQEQLWKEKARDQKFVDGDRNTAYFHRVSRVRAATKSISFLQDGDTIITDPTAIMMHILTYFQAIFSMENNCVQNNLVTDTIPSLVADVENDMLLRIPICMMRPCSLLMVMGLQALMVLVAISSKLSGTLLEQMWFSRSNNISYLVCYPRILIQI